MINKHQKAGFQSYKLENENNMPSKDGIIHVNTQYTMLKDTILNILLTKKKENIGAL